jgi:hypothetical protein
MGGGSTTKTTTQAQQQAEQLASLIAKQQQDTQTTQGQQTSNTAQQTQQTGTEQQTGAATTQGTSANTSTGTQASAGTQATTGQQTSTYQLPSEQQANINLLLQGARDQYLQGPYSYYPNQTYANLTPEQLQAQQLATQYATGVGQDLVNQSQQGASTFLDPNNIFNPTNIPGYAAAQQGVIDTVNRNFAEQLLPAIRSNAISTGNFGGSAQQSSQALAAGRTSDALAQAIANMNMQAYSQGLNQYNTAQAQLPTTLNLGLVPSQILSSVGAENQAQNQKAIDQAVAAYNFNQQAPAQQIAQLQQATGNAGQYGGTTAQAQTGQTTSQQTGTTQQQDTGQQQQTTQSQSTSQQQSAAATQQQAEQQTTQTVQDILQMLGLTNTDSLTSAQGTSTQSSSSQGGLLQGIGAVVSLLSLIP